MIKRYSLYYEYKSSDDILYVFNDSFLDSNEEKRGNVSIVTKNGNFIGYKIYNIQNIIKIKSTGMIFFPYHVLIDIINNILKKQNLEELAYKKHSGYIVGKIIKIDEKITVDVGLDIIECEMVEQATLDDLVVVALQGTGLADKSIVLDAGHICTYADLEINEDTVPFLIEEDTPVGTDFYLMEAK